MKLLWLFSFYVLPFLPLSYCSEPRCLSIPEVSPKKYFHLEGKSLYVTLEVSNRITHQLSTQVFYIFIKEVLGYSKIKINYEEDNFQIDNVMERLSDQHDPIAKTMINLEVWVPPDYDTYATEVVKECGSIAPPGRFGWFIPIELTKPIEQKYHRFSDIDVRSIHWPFFRDRDAVKPFDVEEDLLDNLIKNYAKKHSESKEYVCDSPICQRSMYIPPQCENGAPCALLLTSHFNATNFVINHIKEETLCVKVLWLGYNLKKAIEDLKNIYKTRKHLDKSMVILNWTPSDVILHERDFISVTFENCELMNFTHNEKIGCKYEMHRLVKVAWSKVEKNAKPLYDGLRSFKFKEKEFEFLLDLYQKDPNRNVSDIACEWMRKSQSTWMHWINGTKPFIYIGGIFPMTKSSYNGQGIVKGAVMARNAINNNASILADYNLQILITDGQCQADNVMKNFIDFIVEGYYVNLVGVLGPACSDTVEPLAGVSKHYHIMVISYSAEGASFSNREKYPYFFRTIGENKHYTHVYLKLFEHFRWKRVAALTEDGQKYTEYISHMQDDLEKNQISFISNKKFPRERQTEAMTRYLEDLKNKRARIIIADVVDEVARAVMCEAYRLKMTAVEGYVWFLPTWLNRTWYDTDFFNKRINENVNCTTAQMTKAITGHFSMTHAYFAPDDAVMQENVTVGEWKQRYVTFANGSTSHYAGFAYDAVWTYALALDKLSKTDPEALSDIHSESTTNKLVKQVEATDFYGVSGRIKFRGGPSRFSVINIMEWYDGDSHLIGYFHPNLTDDRPEILGGQLRLNFTAIKWFTRDGKRPDDGSLPPSVCYIEGMARALNVECQTAVIILNMIVAVILVVVVVGMCLYMKKKYDKKVTEQKKYMQKLGLRYDKTLMASDLDKWEVKREHIVMNRKLGEGTFGTVYGGEAAIPGLGWASVAVKTLKKGSDKQVQIDFLSEAENMKRFDHQNVIKLLGVVTKDEPIYMLMEFMLFGDLKTFLLARRDLVHKNTVESEEVSPKKLTNMALDVARGLSYLAEMKYVHRDLACRNCLLDAARRVKLGDFGMTRPVYENDCYEYTRKGLLPVRWMAPECIEDGVYTSSSDVWSYGVVLYEIVTFGCMPFPTMTNMEVMELVRCGHTLEIPKGIKPQLEGLMKSCWNQDYKNRPAASEIVEFLANNPRLLAPCMDIPLASIQLEDPVQMELPLGNELRKRSTSSNLTSPTKAQVMSMANGVGYNNRSPIFQMETMESKAPAIENCCKQPLLGSGRSTSSLINFGKYVQLQHVSRNSTCQDEDEGFIASSPPNGCIINTNV